MRWHVAAVIPAHNEEVTIAGAVADLAGQTYPLDFIVVVNDCSTDDTARVLAEMQKNLPQLVVLDNHVPRLRAGAVNRGLEFLRDKPIDLVVVADADSRFDRHLVEEAVACFERYPRLGGVCSTAGVLPPEGDRRSLWRRLETWFLWRLQRLEGAGFDAVRTATWQDVVSAASLTCRPCWPSAVIPRDICSKTTTSPSGSAGRDGRPCSARACGPGPRFP